MFFHSPARVRNIGLVVDYEERLEGYDWHAVLDGRNLHLEASCDFLILRREVYDQLTIAECARPRKIIFHDEFIELVWSEQLHYLKLPLQRTSKTWPYE